MTKLAELRAKTDAELAALIGEHLDQALYYAMKTGSPDHGAEETFAQSRRLLSAVEDPRERARLQIKLDRLRHALEQSSSQEVRAGAVL